MKHYNPDDERGKDVYYHLLHILTKDKDIQDPEACLAFAFEILNRHFAEIDIPKVCANQMFWIGLRKLFNKELD